MVWLTGKKTYIVAIVAVLAALVAAWNGTISWIDATGAILAALGFSGLRAAIK